MTSLPTTVHKDKFELALVRRVGRVAIYRQHRPVGNPDHDAYEVILAQVRNTNHKGQPVGPYEGYPAAGSWGKKGWTFTDMAKAVQKLNELAEKASCAGTVSRKKRSDGQTHQEGPCKSTIGQGRPVKGQAGSGVPVKYKVNEHGPVCELAATARDSQ